MAKNSPRPSTISTFSDLSWLADPNQSLSKEKDSLGLPTFPLTSPFPRTHPPRPYHSVIKAFQPLKRPAEPVLGQIWEFDAIYQDDFGRNERSPEKLPWTPEK